MGEKILINMSRIGKEGTGMYNYSCNLIQCANAIVKQEIDLLLLKRCYMEFENHKIILPGFINEDFKINILKQIIWSGYNFMFPIRSFNYSISATHHPLNGIKHQIVTLHDLRPYFFPDNTMQKIYFQYCLPRILARVDGIFTVSNTSKKMIVDIYQVEKEKVYVIPNVIDVSKFHKKKEIMLHREKYLLMVGASWRHKNAHEVIEKYPLWRDDYKLKIVCKDGAYKEFLKKLVYKNKIVDSVEFFGYLKEMDLIRLYQKASALIYPSFMEGFGIPPLEAMACGTPVIVSDLDVFRECYGDIPIYVKLKDLKSWRNAFQILKDSDIAVDVKKRGIAKAKEYNLTKMNQAFHEAIFSIWPELGGI